METRTLMQTEIVKSPGRLPSRIVLCLVNDRGAACPFVTWLEVINEDKSISHVHGHYFHTLREALANFDERADFYNMKEEV